MLQTFSKLTSLVASLAMPCAAKSQKSLDNKETSDHSKSIGGHFGTWYDTGASSNSPAGPSQDTAFWGTELVLNKELGLHSFNLTLRSQLPIGDAKELEEFNIHLQWSRQINDNLTLSLALNNYFYPEIVDSTNAYHELETRVDYIFNSFCSYFYLDQEFQNNGYSYAALGTSYTPIEIAKGLSFTPGLELSAILGTGEVYTKTGLDNLALSGTLTYQIEENAPQLYLTLSANRDFHPKEKSLRLV